MHVPLDVEEIDQLLDELEKEASASRTPRQRFVASVLERLSFVLGLRGAGLYLQADQGQWLTAAQSGAGVQDAAELCTLAKEQDEFVRSADAMKLAVPIRKGNWRFGSLVAQFEKPVAAGQSVELASLIQAFADVIAIRDNVQTEKFLDEIWPRFLASIASLAPCESLDEAAYRIVNDLANLLEADRVALIPSSGPVRAVSSTVRPEHRSETVAAIVQAGRKAIALGTPLSQGSVEPTSELPNSGVVTTNLLGKMYACIPFPSARSSVVNKTDTALLIEWDDDERFSAGCTLLNHIFPTFVSAWQQINASLRIPRPLRRIFAPPTSRFSLNRLGRYLRLGIIVAVLGGAIYGLNIPVPVKIDANGSLQPVVQRIVFAPSDGIVSKLLAQDGELVKEGEPLAKMQSPELTLQLQDVRGEILANREKRDGLNVAVNQIVGSSSDALVLQNRLSSEIRQLETQLANLVVRQDALKEMEQQMLVRSPIGGVVVSSDIERYLDSRPVRRGDPLFRIVDLEGPWRLELLVADKDIGYVKRKLFDPQKSMRGMIPESADRAIEYVIASQPDKRLDARLTWISDTARNPSMQGMYIDMFAEIPDDLTNAVHMGASVNGVVACQEEPCWFVWSRPLIEAIHRKLWF